jgi:hypothetical protein
MLPKYTPPGDPAAADGDRLDRGPTLRYEDEGIKNPKEGNVAIDLSGGNPSMDYVQAEQTYKQFIFFTKVAIVFLVVLLAGMAYFLV